MNQRVFSSVAAALLVSLLSAPNVRGTCTASVSAAFDAAASTVTGTASGGGACGASAIHVILDGHEIQSAGCEQASCSTTFSFGTACLATGTHRISAWADCGKLEPDVNGNPRCLADENRTEAVYDFAVNSKPTVSISYEGPDELGHGTATVNYSFSNTAYFAQRRVAVFRDDRSVFESTFQEASGTFTVPINLSCLAAGAHPLKAVAWACGGVSPTTYPTDPNFIAEASTVAQVPSTKPTVDLSYSMDSTGHVAVDMAYAFPNTGSYWDRTMWLFLDGREIASYRPGNISGSEHYQFDVMCLHSGTHELRAAVNSCNASGGEFNSDVVKPLVLQSKPTVDISASGLDSDGQVTVTITSSFPNTADSPWTRTVAYYRDGNFVMNVPSGTYTFKEGAQCWANGTHELKAIATRCLHGGDPDYESWDTDSVEINHHPAVGLAVVDAATGPDALISWSFPNLSATAAKKVFLYWLPTPEHPNGALINWWPVTASTPNPIVVHLGEGAAGVLRAVATACEYDSDLADAPVNDFHCCSTGSPFGSTNIAFGTGAADASPSSCTGGPIRLSNGNMRYTDRDPLPAAPLGLLIRTYDSKNSSPLSFGVGWSSVFDAVLTRSGGSDARSTIVVRTADDESLIFERGAADTYRQTWPAGEAVPATLVFDAALNTFRLRLGASRTVQTFDASTGRMSSIADARSGRRWELTFDSGGMPSAARDSWGNVSWTISAPAGRIETISVDGRPDLAWQYRYDGSGHLTSVEVAGHTYRSYEYSGGRLASIRDAIGSLIEGHVYDSRGRATTSTGSTNDIVSLEYDQPGGAQNEFVVRETRASGAVSRYYLRPVAGRVRTMRVDGGCGSCGARDATYAYDAQGHLVRVQDARGFISVYEYVSGKLAKVQHNLRPSGCDPDTDPARCRVLPDLLGTLTLSPTDATLSTEVFFEDATWPEDVTRERAASVLVPGGQLEIMRQLDPATGTVLTEDSSGYSGNPPALEHHVTSTRLYAASEPAAFDPGAPFNPAWRSLPQPPGSIRSVDGARSDVSDVTDFVYFPVNSAVPALLRGRLAAVRSATGLVTRYESYDEFGNATRVVDPNGVVTITTYDALGRLITQTIKAVQGCDMTLDPLCATDITSAREYANVAGPLQSSISPRGGYTRYEYDTFGRLLTTSRGSAASNLLEQIENAYDPVTGFKTQERALLKVNGSWQEKKTLKYSYDTEGRLFRVYYPPYQTPLTIGDFDENGYDAAGQLVSRKDANHVSANTLYKYDSGGRLSRVQQRLGGRWITTAYEYDGRGNLRKVTDPQNNVTSYDVDDFGRTIAVHSPVTGTTTMSYDAAGNLRRSADANGAETLRTFDAGNRVLTATSQLSGATESVAWQYDSGTFAAGRLAAMNDPSGATAFAYTRNGQLATETKTNGAPGYAISYRYDADGNRSSITYPSGRIVNYQFDLFSRPIGAQMQGTTLVTSAKYLPFGPMTEMVLGNGTSTAVEYDLRYQISTNRLDGTAAPIASYAYGHDAVGNITAIDDALNATYSRAFGYDDLNRITVANTGSSLWGVGSYVYDDMGNLKSSTLGQKSTSLSYAGTTPKLLEVSANGGSTTVAYDAAGNELTGAAFTDAFSYSPRNLVAEAHTWRDICTEPDLGGCALWEPFDHSLVNVYDARGLRAFTIENDTPLLVEVNPRLSAPLPPPPCNDCDPEPPDRTVTTEYFYTPELSHLGDRNAAGERDVIWFGSRPLAIADGTSIRYLHTDHLGTPFLATDASGAVTWRVEYEPYGNVFATRVGAQGDVPLRFAGQRVAFTNGAGDEENYNIFRWYRSGWGRYTQSDPIGLAGGINVYAYAGENPETFVDPLGLVCGIYVWTEDLTYDWSLSNWRGAFKRTWGHRWIEYPGFSAGFWPVVKPTDPISGVPGKIQSPDPNSKVSHSEFTKSDTYFQQTPQRCFDCEKTKKCIADFARAYKCDYSLGLNNCRDFVDQVLGSCGLTTQSPTEYWSNRK